MLAIKYNTYKIIMLLGIPSELSDEIHQLFLTMTILTPIYGKNQWAFLRWQYEDFCQMGTVNRAVEKRLI